MSFTVDISLHKNKNIEDNSLSFKIEGNYENGLHKSIIAVPSARNSGLETT